MLEPAIPHDELRRWAAAHGLEYEQEGLLEPLATPLRAGLGTGAHPASLVVGTSPIGDIARGGLRRYPERASHNICRGPLPGGIDGVLAHHYHLESRSSSSGSWLFEPDTVVLAHLPERSRAACELSVHPGEPQPAVVATATIDLGKGTPVPHPPIGTLGADGRTWTTRPAEPDAAVATIAAAARAALAAAPADTRVELTDGVLCVWAPGRIDEPARLEALCAVAAAVAAGGRAVVGQHGDLDASTRLDPPAASERQRWIDAGARLVQWDEPPASVLDARTAYLDKTRAHSRGQGRKVGLIVLAAGLLVSVAWFGFSVQLGISTGDPLWIGGAVIGLLGGIKGTFSAARSARKETAADLDLAQAGPWGLEAFALGYARARGLVLEDLDSFRHRFPSPVDGRPQRVMHGDLRGVTGHLVMWLDLRAKQHWMLAVVPGSGGEADPPAPYKASRRGALLVVGVPVADADRSAASLDALVAVTRDVAARERTTAV